ncbi:hypothetical protein AUG19_05400 [archaeon 13_1_20CM_2_54_9]|nr:MAG: hypothetical protein AUJ07_08145 [Crenarchaeota archaeon 13_1_40CM_3_53_5]OLE75338.1 MAG: hypothetical protein AUG19_05400 [archaeon 13_1_20CM_2_54_9]
MRGEPGSTLSVTNLDRLEEVRSMYYARLAEHFLQQFGVKPLRRVVEAGCGKGQLTIPLAKRLLRSVSVIAVDSSTGPYEGSFEILESKLRSNGLERRVRPIRSDLRNMKTMAREGVDVVISNELLCDIKTEIQLLKTFKEFHRILRPGGMMVHGEWASSPENEAQRIVIRADSPEGTDTPGRFWNPDRLSGLAREAGFRAVSVSYFETTMKFSYSSALSELRSWGVRESFLRRNDRLLRQYGIELPFEHLIKCQKEN